MKKLESCFVRLWNQDVGVLLWDPVSETASFQYTDDFIKSGLNISPLMMPLSNKVYQFKELVARDDRSSFWGLPGVFADSLPEKYGNKLMKDWLERQNKQFKDLNPIERLCYVGKRGMGALEFEPAEDLISNSEYEVNVDEMLKIARQILQEANQEKHEIDKNKNLMDQLITIGTSAGGAKAKAVIATGKNESGKFTKIFSGQAEPRPELDYWILKFSDTSNSEHLSDKDTGRLEYAYYLMAKACKIEMTKSLLLTDSNGIGHFMTKRFDRLDGQKIHMATFCGLAHEDRNPVGMSSYEKLFKTCDDMKLSQDRILQLYRRMVFNIMARNQDDHTKNHSFLMFKDGTWDLSPAYDICFSYDKESRFIAKQQMNCNNKRDDFTTDDLLACAKSSNIQVSEAQNIIKEVKTVVESWKEFADQAGLTPVQSDAIYSTFRLNLL